MEPDRASLDILRARVEAADKWPVPWEEAIRRDIQVWRAMFETDHGSLKDIISWDNTRAYVADPLPHRIATAHADLIYGEDPVFTAGDEADQDYLDEFIEENTLPSELQRTAAAVVAEGEQWWRLFIDPEQLDVPILEWHSRLDVIPLFAGKKIVAAAFVSELEVVDDKENKEASVFWRYIEYQSRGVIENALYKGQRDKLGSNVPLESHEDVADLDEEWVHGLDFMLSGRVVNGFGSRGYRVGKSEYEGVKDMLLALNEAATIGQENARLTAKKRVIVPSTYVDQHGRTPLDDDVIVRSEAHQDPDKPDAGFAQLEWSFDAQALIDYSRDLIGKIVSRCGLTLHFVDANSGDGTADSGTALRLRMLPSSIAAQGKARYWDDELPRILMIAALLDSLDDEFDRPWTAPEELPGVERTDPIPPDPTEDATRIVSLRASSLISKETSLEILFPDWTEDRRQEELDRLAVEAAEQQRLFSEGEIQPPNIDLEEEEEEIPLEEEIAETG